MIRDRNIDWKVGRTYIPWNKFTGSIGVEGTGHAFSYLEAGTPVAKEISTLNLAGLLMDTAADTVSHNMVVPQDWDPNYPLKFSVNWTSGSATTADTIDWVILCDFTAEGAALAAASTVLNTAIAQDLVTGAYHNQWTAQGIRNANWLTRAQVDAGRQHMVVSVEMHAFAVGLTEDKFFLGLEIEFTRRMTKS